MFKALILSLGFLATAAQAQVVLPDNTKNLSSGFEFGVAAARNRLTDNGTANLSGFNLSAGYRFNQYITAEVRYLDVARANDSAGGVSVDAKIYGVDVSALGTFPIGPYFGLFARAGALNWHADSSASDGETYSTTSSSGTDFIWGFGATATFGNAKLRFEYNRSDIGSSAYDRNYLGSTSSTTFEQLSLGVNWLL